MKDTTLLCPWKEIQNQTKNQYTAGITLVCYYLRIERFLQTKQISLREG